MPRSKSRRVVVVGGGVVGCATAYELARAGFAVTLIERDEIGAHASGHNAGNLNPLHGTPVELIPFALASYRLHANIRKELSGLGCAGCAATPVDRIHLGYDETDRSHLAATTALFNATSGFSASWLEKNDLCKFEPRLDPGIAFAIMTTGGLAIESYDFTRSLAFGATRFGASILQATVLGIAASGAKATAVRTDHGLIACDEVIFATGPWIADTESWLGIEVAVEPAKGELLLLGMEEETPLYDFTWRSTCLYRRRRNEIWLGVTLKKGGFDCQPTASARESLLSRAAQIFPVIRRAKVLDHTAALRPMSRSNMPIAEAAEGWANVYIANGGGAKGVLLSVGIARRICDLLLDGRSDFPLSHPAN
jgi:glycine/D-amino acid oxidase-like deaminating enzyme